MTRNFGNPGWTQSGTDAVASHMANATEGGRSRHGIHRPSEAWRWGRVFVTFMIASALIIWAADALLEWMI